MTKVRRRRTNKRKFMKRRFNRRKGGRRATTFKQGMPNKFFIDLVYTQTFQWQLDATLIDNYRYHLFRGNDAFDPLDEQFANNYSANEYQKLGQIYQFCKVIGSDIKVEVANYNSNIPAQLVVAPVTIVDNIGPDSFTTQRFAKQSRLFNREGTSAVVMNHSMSTHKIFGIPSLKYDNDHHYSTRTPVGKMDDDYTWWWKVMVMKPYIGGSGDGLNVVGRVTIRYKCVFYEKITISMTVAGGDDEEDTILEAGVIGIGLPGVSTDGGITGTSPSNICDEDFEVDTTADGP